MPDPLTPISAFVRPADVEEPKTRTVFPCRLLRDLVRPALGWRTPTAAALPLPPGFVAARPDHDTARPSGDELRVRAELRGLGVAL